MINSPEWHREHPIYGTDFSKSPDILIEEIRTKLSMLRGQLGDIGYAYPGFKDQLDDVHGLLTCGISFLYSLRQDMEKCFKTEENSKEKNVVVITATTN